MRDLRISCGASFFDQPSTQSFTWASLVNLLSQYDTSSETLAQYLELPKAEQLKLKDRGWYNGNTYTRPERHEQYIGSIDLLTLDIDNGEAGIADAIVAELDPVFGDDGFAFFLGSTRKHTPDKPRLRLVVPLSRPCTPDEADALRRMVAFRIGMPACDIVSFRANQVMFWPSRCADGQVYVRHAEGAWLDVDAKLAHWYPNGWQIRESWPLHPREEKGSITREQKKVGDPHDKPGLIGLWCRTYTITDILHEFLTDEYLPGSKDDRWTHAGGTAGDGAIIYSEKWLYSHHQTDPGSGRLLNAWDLVRVHKFGTLDAKARPDASVMSLPSTKAMTEWVQTVPEFKRALAAEAAQDFKPLPPSASAEAVAATKEEAAALAEKLSFNKGGKLIASHENLRLMLTEHPTFRGALGYNVNADGIVWRRFMPWHDETRQLTRFDETEGLRFHDIDYIRVREWLVSNYHMELPSLALLHEVVDLVADLQRFHPIRDYLRSLPAWDGVKRIDSLFVRYLGATDNEYTRAAARSLMVGMVKRMMEPGCKFDTVVLIIGPQRIRKSTFIETLALRQSWFSDDLPKLDTTAIASIKSLWVCEIAELAALGRVETEFVKSFLSRRVDRARLSYRRNVENFPRQCVFVGTSNNGAPLKDPTGNGRFLPIWTSGYEELTRKIDIEALRLEVEQLHAEAYAAWKAGEVVYIAGGAAAEQAREAQDQARADDPIARAIDGWLDGELPSKRSPSGSGANEWQDKPQLRLKTCIAQIACEALSFNEYGTDWPPWLAGRIVDHLHSRTDWGKSTGTSRLPGYGKPRCYVRFANAERNPDSPVASRKAITAEEL